LKIKENILKFCYIDIETTGVNLGKSEIIQISGIFENSETEKTFSFSHNVRPFNYKDKDIYDDWALDKNGLTIEEISKFPEPKIVYEKITTLFNKVVNKFDKKDKMFFIGYNCKFDYDFLYWWFEKNGDNFFSSYFWFPPIDVCQLAALSVMEIRQSFKNFKLETVCEAFEVVPEKTNFHNSLFDVELTRKLFKKITN
jgi:DNA polymerase III epsilon subunit-like protein